MSGNDSVRNDGDGGIKDRDDCLRTWRGPINSPKAAVLTPLLVGQVLGVRVDRSNASPVLIVTAPPGVDAGSLTFHGYLDIIACMIERDVKYKATLVGITGGVYEVRVDPA